MLPLAISPFAGRYGFWFLPAWFKPTGILDYTTRLTLPGLLPLAQRIQLPAFSNYRRTYFNIPAGFAVQRQIHAIRLRILVLYYLPDWRHAFTVRGCLRRLRMRLVLVPRGSRPPTGQRVDLLVLGTMPWLTRTLLHEPHHHLPVGPDMDQVWLVRVCRPPPQHALPTFWITRSSHWTAA